MVAVQIRMALPSSNEPGSGRKGAWRHDSHDTEVLSCSYVFHVPTETSSKYICIMS